MMPDRSRVTGLAPIGCYMTTVHRATRLTATAIQTGGTEVAATGIVPDR